MIHYLVKVDRFQSICFSGKEKLSMTGTISPLTVLYFQSICFSGKEKQVIIFALTMMIAEFPIYLLLR